MRAARRPAPRRRGRLGWPLARRALRWALALAAAWYALCALGLLYLRFGPPLVTAVQVQRLVESWVGGDRSPMRQHAVALARISPHLQHAVVAAEDSRFFEHAGIDWQGIREAVQDNWRRGRVRRGGSTITQQLVKNLFLTTHGSLLRKVAELPLALLADLLLPKRRILKLYLNVVEWGPAVFGAEAAAQFHYQVSAATLSRHQAASLAACLPDPRRRTPQRMPRYAAVIERRMAAMGW